MNLLYLHGMGGGAEDFSGLPKGRCLEISTLSWDKTVDKLVVELESLREPFLLCGYSMGGRLALASAARVKNPNFRALVLLSTGFGFHTIEEKAARESWDKRWVEEAKKDPQLFWQKWYQQELFSSLQGLPKAHLLPWLQRKSVNLDAICHHLSALSPAKHSHLQANLSSLKNRGVSLLYMAGEQDKKYADLARQVEAMGIPTKLVNAGHVLPFEAPDFVAKELQSLCTFNAE